MHHPDGLGGQNRADVLAAFVEDEQRLRNLVRQSGPPDLVASVSDQHAPAERFQAQDPGARRGAREFGCHDPGRVEDPPRQGLIARWRVTVRWPVRGRQQVQRRAATFDEGGHARSARPQQYRDRRVGAGEVRIGAVSSGLAPGGDQVKELRQAAIGHRGMYEHRLPSRTLRGDSQRGQRLEEGLAPGIGRLAGGPHPGCPVPARPEASVAIRSTSHLGQPDDQARRPPLRHLHGRSPARLITQRPGRRVAHQRLDLEGPSQPARAQVPPPAGLQQIEQADAAQGQPGHVCHLPSPYRGSHGAQRTD